MSSSDLATASIAFGSSCLALVAWISDYKNEEKDYDHDDDQGDDADDHDGDVGGDGDHQRCHHQI